MKTNSHDGSYGSQQHDDSAVLPRSDNSLPPPPKPPKRSSSSKSIKNQKLRNGLGEISPNKPHNLEGSLSLANAALHMHQTPISPSITNPTSKVDGVVPLVATRHQVAEHSTPVSLPAKGRRNDNDVAAITNALHQGLVLNISNLNLGSNAIKIEAAMASARLQNAPIPPSEFQSSTGISLAAEGEKRSSTQGEAVAASPTPEGELEYESMEDESETEPGAGLIQEVDSSIEGFGGSDTDLAQVIAAREVEEESEALEAEPEPMAMRMEVNFEAEAEAEEEAARAQEQDAEELMLAAEAEPELAVAEADAEVASIMSIEELRSAQEADEVKEEVEAMPPLEEIRAVEAAEADPILHPQTSESKQEAEEYVLFAEQDEYKQQVEEKPMAKLFELPLMTPAQQAINRNIRDAFSLVDEGDQQLKVKEDQGLIIFGKSKSGKSTLANMLAGRELMATENAKGWQIVLTDPEMHSEGAAAASGRGSPVGNNIYRSETQIPHKSTVQGTAIIDVPGFFDIKGFSTDAAHSMLYARALKNTSNLKLVLVVAQNTIDSADAQYELMWQHFSGQMGLSNEVCKFVLGYIMMWQHFSGQISTQLLEAF